MAAQEHLDGLPEQDRVPTNSLFQAYDAVLPAHGIDPENDQHLSRLVFRIGGERGEGTLLEKFGSVLSRMGIELEFDTSSIPAEPELSEVSQTEITSPRFRPTLVSRAKFAEKDLAGGAALPSADSETESPSSSKSAGTTATETAHTTRLISHGHPAHIPCAGSIPQHNLPAQPPRRNEPARHTPVDLPMALRPSGTNTLNPVSPTASEDKQALLDDLEDASADERTSQLAELELAFLGQRLFNSWLNLTTPPENTEEYRRILAETVYERNVTEALLTQWKDLAYWKRSAAQEAACLESYAVRCDRVAGRARQIYVLTTGFVLWHQLSALKTERTAVARRHILRLRHFDSWKEVALGDYRAIRTFVHRVYLPRWNEQLEVLKQKEETAHQARRQTLLSNTFTEWQRLTFESTVQSRRSRRLKESAFHLWLQASQLRVRATADSDKHHKAIVVVKTLRDWLSRSKHLGNHISSSAHHFQGRMLSTLFSRWLALPRGDAKATNLYAKDTLSKYFHLWNLDTKVKIFKVDQDLRLASQYFLLWVTLQKIETFRLERDDRFRAGIFKLFLRRSGALESMAQTNHMLPAAVHVSQPVITSLFELWHQLAEDSASLNAMVLDRSHAATKVNNLNDWFEATTHDTEMERWAQRGAFYLSVHGRFGDWKTWAKRERERKLRVTYTMAKNEINERLVLGCWEKWRAACVSTVALNRTWTHVVRTHDQELLASVMKSWMRGVRHALVLDQHSQHLLKHSLLDNWRAMAEACIYGDAEASQLWVERILDSCWTRWNIAFQWAEGQSYNAANTIERRRREALIKNFLLWGGVNSGNEPEEDVGQGSVNAVNAVLSQSDAAWREVPKRHRFTPGNMQLWSRSNFLDPRRKSTRLRLDSDDGDLDSLVGTINTPTRRTGPARSLAGLPSTTPAGPLPTPYERELRERYMTRTKAKGEYEGES